MALITCPECGKTISDKASACIGCGCPVSAMNPTPAQSANMAVGATLFGYAALADSGYGIASRSPQQTERVRTRRSQRARVAQEEASVPPTAPQPEQRTLPVQPTQAVPEQAATARLINQLSQIAQNARPVAIPAAQPAKQPVRPTVQPAAQTATSTQSSPPTANSISIDELMRSYFGSSANAQSTQAVPKQAASMQPAQRKANIQPATPTAQSVAKPVQVSKIAPQNTRSAKPAAQPAQPPAQPAKPAVQPAQPPAQPAKPAVQPSNPEPATPTKTVPEEMPEAGLGFGIILEMLSKLCGMCGYAAFAAIAVLLVDFLASGSLENPFTTEIVLGIGVWYILAHLISWLEFLRVKRFLKKGGYEECIRNDTPSMTNAYRAFGLKRTHSMLRYISRLNPAAGESLKEAIKHGTAAKRQRRLRYLPYMIILAAAYYLIPRMDMLPLYSDHWFLIIEHLVTLVVMIIYARKHSKDFEEKILEMVLVVTGIFALMFFVYYSSDLWYHILICAALVVVSFFFG